MTSAQEARADGWQRDTAQRNATIARLARENRQLREAAREAAAAERRRIRNVLRNHVVMIEHSRTPDGQVIYASGPLAFPDVLADAIDTTELETTDDRS